MKKLKIKLSRQEVDALFNIFFVLLTFHEAVGFKNMLIREVMLEVLNQLQRMNENREQKKFTLKLTGAQSLAFIAYCGNIELERTPYEQVIINGICSQIHKTHSNATHI